MNEKILKESYKEHIRQLKEVCILEYLENGFNLDSDSILKAIKYFKICMPLEFKEVILTQDYWNLYYNEPMKQLLIKKFNVTNENHKKAISTFVYTYQNDKRDFEKLEEEQSLKIKLESQGFKEQDISNKEEIIKLNGLKVVCILNITKIGLLGSFDSKETIEGKLVYNNHLYLMPKKCTKRGFLIINKFYYKTLN